MARVDILEDAFGSIYVCVWIEYMCHLRHWMSLMRDERTKRGTEVKKVGEVTIVGVLMQIWMR